MRRPLLPLLSLAFALACTSEDPAERASELAFVVASTAPSERAGVGALASIPGDEGVGVARSAATSGPRDAVVLVHGNGGAPSDWAATVSELLAHGWAASEIFRPSWGSSFCVACNNHCGSEIAPVRAAIRDALAVSATGRIDVLGHSMGVTLAGRAILEEGAASDVDAFVSVVGAFRGLRSCGSYPFSVPNATCGYCGLSVGSPLVSSLRSRRFGAFQAALYSTVDGVVCNCGFGYSASCCNVSGRHTGIPDVVDWAANTGLGHFASQSNTPATQRALIE
ncbi:MAG: lipase [Myxococcota bacterium]